MGSANYSQAIRPDTAYINKIIENSLLSDWSIRIEHHTGGIDTAGWRLWNKAFFAIRSAEAVLESLLDCYSKHPRSSIRIHAEKFHPQCRVLYTVYNPAFLPSDTDLTAQVATSRFRGNATVHRNRSY